MITILTALMLEAAPLISHLGLKKDLSRRDFPVFRGADIMLVVSGTGKIQAAMAIAAMVASNPPTALDLLFNIGFCGSGSTEVPTGTALSIWKVTDMDTGRDAYPDVFLGLDLPAATLHCHAMPVMKTVPPETRLASPESRTTRQVPPQIVAIDMESAGIMAAARVWLAPHQVILLKIVSDHLDPADLVRSEANKERLTGLITGQLKIIDQVIAAWQNSIAPDPSTIESIQSAEEIGCLERVSAKLHLTVAMRRLLTDDLRKARLLGLDPVPILKAALTAQPLDKSAAKQCWHQLRKEILPNG